MRSPRISSSVGEAGSPKTVSLLIGDVRSSRIFSLSVNKDQLGGSI